MIRKHLLERRLNVTLNPNVRIQGSRIRNDMLLLRPTVNSNKLIYAPSEVNTVLEIKNNAVGDQSTGIKRNFDELRKLSEDLRFAVVVLSERKGYTYAITEESLGDKKYRVFTLVSRKKYPKGGLYKKDTIMEMLEKKEMKRTREWDGLVNCLKDSKS